MNMKRVGVLVEASLPFRFRPPIFLGLVFSLVPIQAQETPPPLRFNIPYHCPDGNVYVIQRCEPGPRGEVCFFHYEGNESERYMTRSQLGDMEKRCSVSPAAKSAAQPGRTATTPTGIPNRPTDPPQREVPSRDSLMREIQDAARQQGKSPVAQDDSRTPAKPVTVGGPPDPGIAKARAANVDTKVFGIPLGEPLAIPKCSGGIFDTPTANCIVEEEGTVARVQLAPDNCPTWMNGCIFNATLQNGRFVATALKTTGRGVEATVAKELRGKYGQRASMQRRVITPNDGGSQFEVLDLEWELPGLHVEYKVVNSTILDGYVLIESEPVYADRKAKEPVKPKL